MKLDQIVKEFKKGSKVPCVTILQGEEFELWKEGVTRVLEASKALHKSCPLNCR